MDLSWNDVLAISSPEARAYARLTKQSYNRLISDEIPSKLDVGAIKLLQIGHEKTRVGTYSDFDPIEVSNVVMDLLQYFDGRLTEEVLGEIADKKELRLDHSLVRKSWISTCWFIAIFRFSGINLRSETTVMEMGCRGRSAAVGRTRIRYEASGPGSARACAGDCAGSDFDPASSATSPTPNPERPGCLVPAFDGALFSPAWRDALWDRFFTQAPTAAPALVTRSAQSPKGVELKCTFCTICTFFLGVAHN